MIQHSTIVFLAFLAPTAVALYFHQRKHVRMLFLAYFLLLTYSVGFNLASNHFPFHTWHLYSNRTGTELTFREIRVADAEGNERKFDARATPPMIQTPAIRHAQRFEELEPEEAAEFADFILRGANHYADLVLNDKFPWHEALRFPRHQFGYRWDQEMLADVGSFVELRIYEINAVFSDDGKGVVSVEESLKLVYP